MTLQPTAEAPGDGAHWRPWMAPAGAVAAFTLGLFAASIVAAIGGSTGANASHPTPAVALIGSVVFDFSLLAAALYFARLRGPLRASDFGFRRLSIRTGVGSFLAAAALYYVATAVYAALVRLHGTEKLPSELGVGKSTAALVGAAIFVCVIAPIAEETFFRGFFFGALRRWRLRIGERDFGTLVAAVATAIVFGLAHVGSAPAQYLVPLGFLGFVLCLVRWRTGSLYPCIALHSANNALALGVNELHWQAGEIFALIAGSLLVIAALTGPLSARRTAPAGA
jgi:membrane protease YdiL (CAAX protease family)